MEDMQHLIHHKRTQKNVATRCFRFSAVHIQLLQVVEIKAPFDCDKNDGKYDHYISVALVGYDARGGQL